MIYTYHLLFKDQHLNFFYIYTRKMELFTTFYPVTENELGHTVGKTIVSEKGLTKAGEWRHKKAVNFTTRLEAVLG